MAHGPHLGLLDAVLPFVYDRHPTVVSKAVLYVEMLLDAMGVGDGGGAKAGAGLVDKVVEPEAVLSALAKVLEDGEDGEDGESAKRSLARQDLYM